MHDKSILGGPVWVLAVAVVAIAVGLALFVTVESVRRQGGRTPRPVREPLWTYTLGQGLFLLIGVLVQVAPLPPIMGAVFIALVPFVIAQAFAFLLRVVFPKSPLTDSFAAEIGVHEASDRPAEKDVKTL